jgi:hypothetical protein
MMLKKLFESVLSPFVIPQREQAGIEARKIACLSIIGYHLSGDESFAKLAILGTEIREFLDGQQNTTDDELSSLVVNLKSMRGKLDFLQDQHGLRERIGKAYFALSSGALEFKKSNPDGSVSDEPEHHRIIRLAVIASDTENKLWPEAEVMAAQCAFGLNGVPTYETLCNNFGKTAIDLSFQKLQQERIAMLEKIKYQE